MKILAFIPARKGSKRVLNKNIKLCAGKPLIAWTIESALKAKQKMDIVVSTDSNKIAEISKKYGAEIPFLRPDELANDTSTTYDAMKYTLNTLAKQGRVYDFIMLLQPTSPVRQASHIDEAFRLLLESNGKAVVSVSNIDHPNEWTMTLPENNSLDAFIKDNSHYLKQRSQELPVRYRLNGAISCVKVEDFLNEGTFYLKKGVFAYPMENKYSVDIDELSDFEYAQYLLSSS
ncbi:MAG: acylneuraminate cytidylyltransferase family protein [Gammaproteobacteria bacterium]|nr:acylneuraminate cytidylyltransferase family protein [Gammaproteobacteria bacterium]